MASYQLPVRRNNGLGLVMALAAFGFSPAAANDPVSMTVTHIHRCVTSCAYLPRVGTDIGDILRCGTPYLNDCYCATATADLSNVESFATACASSKCQAGDHSYDVSGIKAAYASYCAGAGYDQGLQAWFAPAEATQEPDPPATTTTTTTEGGDAADGGNVETTTQLTIVTQTTAGNDAGTVSRVVVHATSTVWVDPSGSQVSGPSAGGGGGSNTVALGAGIGAGVGVAVIVVGVLVWVCMRRRRRDRTPDVVVPPSTETAPSMAAVAPTPIVDAGQSMSRKPVATASVIPSPGPASELNGHGQRPELGSNSVFPAPVSPMSPPTPAPVQARPQEMWNSSPPPELYGQGASPPTPAPVQVQPQEMSNSSPRPELYGQGASPPPTYHQLYNTNRSEMP